VPRNCTGIDISQAVVPHCLSPKKVKDKEESLTAFGLWVKPSDR